MSVQATSLQAYDELIKSQKLGAHQLAVWAVIQEHPEGMTNLELAGLLHWPINSVTPRVFELREKGLVGEVGRRTCRLTGRQSIAWGIAHRTEYQMELYR